MRKAFRRDNLLLWAMVAIGTVCCLTALYRRAAAEDADRAVAYAISLDHVQLLARTSGRSLEEWLDVLRDSGVHYLIGSNLNERKARATAEAAGMEFARSGAVAWPSDAFLLPSTTASMFSRSPVYVYDRPHGSLSVPLVLVENWKRTGQLMPQSFDPNQWDGPMVKGLYLYAEYRQNFAGEGAISNTENILFLAATDRNVRLIVLTPLTPHTFDTGEIVTDMAAYQGMLASLSRRLAQRGLNAGGEFSMLQAPRRSGPLLAGMSLLPAAMAVLLLCVVLQALGKAVKPLWKNALLVLGIIAALAGGMVVPNWLQKLVPFGTAVLAGCWASLWLCYLAYDGDTLWRKAAMPLALRCVAATAGLLCCSLAGALCIGALLADRGFMLQFKVFTGVKAAQLAPILFCAAALFWVLFRRNRRRDWRRVSPALVIFLGVAVAAALVVLILRSGDNMLPVSQLELDVRSWLELKLYARPRTKEFLLAFPALALFVTACERQTPLLALPLGVLSSVAATSVINTFCHIFTPLRVSLARTFLGAGIGLVIGLAGMVVFALLLGKGKQRGTHPAGESAET